MKSPRHIRDTALAVTRWVGSPTSIILHSALFVASFLLSFFGIIPFDRMLLFLTTIVSLEAIYLSIFIQMTINYTTESIEEVSEDIEEIQEDIGEIQEDVDELQEDVEGIAEDEEVDKREESEGKATLDEIQKDLRKLLADVERLKNGHTL
ncbi:MAG: hypothetical protein Q7S05_04860 [bacterium]|nr:hypothetical protein [bacterium]